jgi:hypothetical protein
MRDRMDRSPSMSALPDRFLPDLHPISAEVGLRLVIEFVVISSRELADLVSTSTR